MQLKIREMPEPRRFPAKQRRHDRCLRVLPSVASGFDCTQLRQRFVFLDTKSKPPSDLDVKRPAVYDWGRRCEVKGRSRRGARGWEGTAPGKEFL
jgi:hypothetical protein